MIEEEVLTEEHLQIAESNGIGRRNALQRFNSYGYSVEDAITKPLKKANSDSEWMKWKETALSNGVSCDTFCNRVKHYGYTPEEAATNPPQKRSVIQAKGIETRKRRGTIIMDRKDIEEAEANGIKRATFSSRVHNLGWSIEDAKTLPVGTRVKPRKVNEGQRRDIEIHWKAREKR